MQISRGVVSCSFFFTALASAEPIPASRSCADRRVRSERWSGACPPAGGECRSCCCSGVIFTLLKGVEGRCSDLRFFVVPPSFARWLQSIVPKKKYCPQNLTVKNPRKAFLKEYSSKSPLRVGWEPAPASRAVADPDFGAAP